MKPARSFDEIAARYIWWLEPKEALEQEERLVAQVIELGTWEDAHWLVKRLGSDAFRRVLDNPPPGAISPRSWVFWDLKLGGRGELSVNLGRELPA